MLTATFPIAAPVEAPLALVGRESGILTLTAVDARGHELGLRTGMTLAAARARIPALHVEPENVEANTALLRRLADMCETFTPLVALAPPDGLMLDISGCAHLFGGEARLRRDVSEKTTGFGLTTCAVVAGTPDAARALARQGRNDVVPPGADYKETTALPVSVLELGPERTLALMRAGLTLLGDLTSRPSRLLSARFGEDVTMRLRRVVGEQDVRLTALRPAPDIMAERRFVEPISLLESLISALQALAQEIAGRLEQRGRGGRRFEAVFVRADGFVRRIALETAQPARDPESLLRLLRLRLDALSDPLDPGFGFDAIRLSVLASEPLPARQTELDGRESEDADFGELVDSLIARFGGDRVLRFEARETHDPTRAGCVRSAAAAGASTVWPQPEEGGAPARPLTLFDPPQAIVATAEVPDGPPLQFTWRRMQHRVVYAEGPERIAAEWWRSHAPTRDYYRVENAHGRRFWLFRLGLYEREPNVPRWYIHGLFA